MSNTQHSRASQRGGKGNILLLYLITAGLVALGVLLFAVFYKGGGANALLNASLAQAALPTPNPESEEPDATPAPVLAPASSAGRLVPYPEGGLYGYKNMKGEVVIAPKFLRAFDFLESGYAFAAVDTGGLLRYGLIMRDGNWAVEPQFSNVRAYSEGFAAVEMDEKWGFIDASGKLVIAASYREVFDFHGGRAAVRSMSTYGYIDPDGELAIPAQFDKAGDFGNDMAFVTQGAKSYLIDKVGGKIATLGKESGEKYVDGVAAVNFGNGVYNFYNTSRKTAFTESFEEARNFANGMAAVRKDGKWGFINRKGAVIVAPQYAAVADFSQSLAAVKNDSGKWGYINTSGTVKVPFEYDEAGAFLLDYAVVKQNGITGVVNANGEFVELYR